MLSVVNIGVLLETSTRQRIGSVQAESGSRAAQPGHKIKYFYYAELQTAGLPITKKCSLGCVWIGQTSRPTILALLNVKPVAKSVKLSPSTERRSF